MSKALLIKSYTDLTVGVVGTWNELNMATTYIQGIKTGEFGEEVSAKELRTFVSGVPTPWARAKLFKFALDTLNAPDPSIGKSGLTQYYQELHGEWRGLIALLALHADRIRFSEPVTMNVKGDAYGIAAAFGRMLFEDKDLWSDQDQLERDPDVQPYLHLIYYRDKLVGGTSPLTGCFTGVNYTQLGDDASDITWYRMGKFEDPMSRLEPEQVQKLYLFVKNMTNNLEAYEQKVNSRRQGERKVNLAGFKGMLYKWKEEMERSNPNLREKGPVASYGALACPFSLLFASHVPVYLTPNQEFTYDDGPDYQKIGDIQELLSSDEAVIGWSEDAQQRQKLSDAPVYFLQVKDLRTNSTSYFTIPLSEKGVTIFKSRLKEVLGYSDGGHSHLKAEINDAGQLSVKLEVKIDGYPVMLNTREYRVEWMDNLNKVIVWPDFVSDKWNRYYFYSEFTTEAQQQFDPIFQADDSILLDGLGQFLTPAYQSAPGEEMPVRIDPLVRYPAGLSDDLPKYNILMADKPFAGLVAKVKQGNNYVRAGFLMLRDSKVLNLTAFETRQRVTIGFDFGSNNTCVYYNSDDRGARPIEFDNCRKVLVGQENVDHRANALNNELLFFTNYPAPNGQLKSWLHEHDSRYIDYRKSEEIAGGVPVNRPNVDVREMNEFEILTQAGKLHYNMKWLDNETGLEKKRAFLKSIWLQACAFLYKKRLSPEQINWSHPGSMMEADVNEYEKIYEDLCKMTPFGGKPAISDRLTTEAEAVCSFALSQDFGLGADNLFLGIDVGGSTSDIMLLAKNPSNNNMASMYRESSVRMAAGVFFDAVIKSQAFREAIVAYHEGPQRVVHVSNIKDVLKDPAKAPYYLNSIFDQLKSPEQYDEFYASIHTGAKFVFTIPAYVTGLLLFYSGILIGKAINEHQLQHIKKVDVLSFGKGGRIFHWLRAANNRAANEYYARCLKAGVGVVTDVELEVKYRDEIEVDNKAEVAKGLCDMKDLVMVGDNVSADICGEKGVKYLQPDGTAVDFSVDQELKGEYFANDMNNFSFEGTSNFQTFMDIFMDFVSQKTKLYSDVYKLREDLADLPNRIASFVTNNDNEYKKAKKVAKDSSAFRYQQPILIAEGMCFLDKLIAKAFRQ
ncbi:MAG: hypothetical protein HUK09_02330 [Bacteroidaceae bacterium]|nr:hypothetical protein [Bacteroidaceae bacterium]